MTDRERTRAAFLAEIIAAPADDTPRLIFADYLEEYGDEERAEFIRVQCRLAELRRTVDETPPISVERCDLILLESRERELLKRYGNKWVPRFLREPEYKWLGTTYARLVRDDGKHTVDEHLQAPWYTFRRGFVEEVRCPCAAWLEHGPAVVRAQPVTRVVLTDKEPYSVGNAPPGGFFWHYEHGETDQPSWRLPRWLYEKLTNGRRSYPTRQAALDSLSAACLAWARAAVHDPALRFDDSDPPLHESAAKS